MERRRSVLPMFFVSLYPAGRTFQKNVELNNRRIKVSQRCGVECFGKSGNAMLNFTSMATRIGFVMICVSFITTLCTGGAFVWYTLRENEQNLQDYRDELEDEMNNRLVSETEIVVGMIQKFYSLQQSGQLTETQAKKMAADFTRDLRYNEGQGYFWIDTYEGVNVVMVDPKVEGKSRLDFVDQEGREFIKEMLMNGKRPGGGFTDLMFAKPHGTEPLPKRNYTRAFEPYRWIVGTGEWMDRIDILVKDYEIELEMQFRDKMINMLTYLAWLQIIFLLIAYYAGRSITQPIQFLMERLQAMGKSDFKLDGVTKSHWKELFFRKDELGTLSRAMQETHDKLAEYQNLILNMARNDALTGLANRRYFHEYMSEIKADKYLTLIALDLDHFKEVNDNYDHQTGDAALLILAEVLKDSFPDGLNVRLGGDEFLVVLTKPCELSEVERRVQKFMDKLVGIYQMDPELARLTISAGIARSPEDPQPLDILMQKSDLALYQAKQLGRSCYRVYKKEMENGEYWKEE